MSLEAIKTISEAEEKAKKARAEAAAASKKAISDAEAAGIRAVAKARAKAEEELRELVKKADEKAKAQALELAASTENRMASMRVRAEGNLNKAAELVVERIVNS